MEHAHPFVGVDARVHNLHPLDLSTLPEGGHVVWAGAPPGRGTADAAGESARHVRRIRCDFVPRPDCGGPGWTSAEAARSYPDASLDLVFVEAGRTFSAVRSAIAEWLPKVKRGAVLCGSGYDRLAHPALASAVDVALPLSQIQTGDGRWWFYNDLPPAGAFSVPLSAGPRDYLLFLPFVNRPDLLEKAVGSVRRQWANLVVIDQSEDGLDDPWHGAVAIYRWAARRHFVKAQNFMQRLALLSGAPHFLFMHSDAECANDAVGLLLRRAGELDAAGEKWGVVFTNYDALCVFSRAAVLQVGAWDETFTWYASDVDYYNRLKREGFRQHGCAEAVVAHHVSRTLAALGERERGEVNADHAWARAHYVHKWGGWNGSEVHETPYGVAENSAASSPRAAPADGL